MAPAQTGNWLLTLNAGSSSLKFAAFDVQAESRLLSGQVSAIGPGARFVCDGKTASVQAPDHAQAIRHVLGHLSAIPRLSSGPAIVGHRVVHGGAQAAAAEISARTRADIEAATALAPLHNPPALSVIDALTGSHPGLRQVACFDTAFHASNPAEATTIPLPAELREKGIRRYGFHGLSYASLVRRFIGITGAPLPKRLLAFHLGAGASIAAIVDGKSVATTMGFSPMDGLVMATRSGAMDPGVLLHLMRSEGMGAGDLDDLLNRRGGLAALSGGISDMKTLLETRTPAAEFAVSHYCYWACRHAGSMIAAMRGLDGIIFTGGIGENASAIRSRIVSGLKWAGVTDTSGDGAALHASGGSVGVWVIAADEEGEIAQELRLLLEKSP